MERVNLLKYISNFYFSRQNPVSSFFFQNFYHSDHLGTPRVITDEAGNIIATHKYYPYGEEITSQTQNTLTHKFTGHERDFESNLDYMHARYYHQFMGRFLSVDEFIGKNFSEPQTLNFYTYSSNNPLLFVDMDGLLKRDSKGELIDTPQSFNIKEMKHPSGLLLKVIAYNLQTIKGTAIEAHKVMGASKQTQKSNCHGYTFADSKFLIQPNQVDKILKDEYVQRNKSEKTQLGDIVIFRNKAGEAIHSAKVSGIDSAGNITEVSHKPGINPVEENVPIEKVKDMYSSDTEIYTSTDGASSADTSEKKE